MTQRDDFQRAFEILEALREVPDAERPARLDALCGDNRALRDEVESLLAHDVGGTPFDDLAEGAALGAMAEFISGRDGRETLERIGPYRIVRKVGEGGMGEVYEAEQESPRRRVALKVIRSGLITPQLVRRFENEAFVLGQLQHPGIAHIYESGMVALDGQHQPFFAMEYIDGVRITTFAKQQHLDVRQRLALFAQVCDAVQHAHQKGVIHRDLKPGNILIVARDAGTTSGTSVGTPTDVSGGARTGARAGTSTGLSHVSADHEAIGQPKILDFGIARMTDSDTQTTTLQTEVGQLVGTLAYMSPEQVAGDSSRLDPRCDIYALGVVLYQLLTDRLPLDLSDQSLAEAARMIRDDDPSLASEHDRRLRGDIDTIISKALEKDPSWRYFSAGELALDVRRHLRDEPIAARPASTLYNVRKFARRNRGLVGGLAATFVVLLVGAAGTTAGLVSALRANRALEQTNVALADTNQELEASNEALAEANHDLKRVSEFQSAQLTGIDIPGMGLQIRANLLEDVPELRRDQASESLVGVNFTDVARSALRTFVFDRALQTIEADFADQPLLQARLLHDVARVLRVVGMPEAALAPQLEALKIRRSVFGETHPSTVAANEGAGLLYMDLEDPDAADVHFQAAWDVERETLGDDHPSTISGLSNRAAVESRRGNVAEAEAAARAALERLRQLDPPPKRQIADTLSVLGGILGNARRFSEAEAVLREALDRRRAFFGEEHRLTLQTQASLAVVLEDQGKLVESSALIDEVAAVQSRLFGDDHPATLNSRSKQARLLAELSRFDEAETILRDTLERQRRLLGMAHVETLRTQNSLAGVMESLANLLEAEALYREALPYMEQVYGRDETATLSLVGNLALLLNQQGKGDEAEPLYRRVYEGFRSALGEDDPLTLSATGNFAVFLSSRGRHAEAEPLYYAALEGRRKLLGPDHPSTLNATFNLGYYLRAQGKFDEAQALCQAALDGYARVLGPDHIGTLFSLAQMGNLRLEQGRPGEAEAFFETLLERRRRIFGDSHPGTIFSRSLLATALEAQERWSEVETWRRLALDLVMQSDAPNPIEVAGRQAMLADTLIRLSRFSEAETLLRESLELFDASPTPTHWRRWDALSLLGEAIAQDPGRRDEAEALLVEAAARIAVPDDVIDANDVRPARIARTHARLAEFYRRVGRDAPVGGSSVTDPGSD